MLAWSGSAPMGRALLGAVVRTDDTTLTEELAIGTRLQILKREGPKRLRMHRLVQEVMKETLPLPEGDVGAICCALCDWFEARKQDFALLPVFEDEFDHLVEWQRVARRRGFVREGVRLLWLQAYPPFHWGDYRKSLGILTEALNDLRTMDHADLPMLAHVLNDLGVIHSHLGDHAKSLSYELEALDIRLQLYGESHRDTAMTMNNVATASSRLGKYDVEREYGERALRVRKQLLGDGDRDTAQSMLNVAATYTREGDTSKALSLGKQALAAYMSIGGEFHPDTARAIDLQGRVYSVIGDNDKAIECARRALAIRVKLFGESNPDTALSLQHLGVSLSVAGRHGEALAPLARALTIQKSLLGEGHPEALETRARLAGASWEGASVPGKRAILKDLDAAVSIAPRGSRVRADLISERQRLAAIGIPGFRTKR